MENGNVVLKPLTKKYYNQFVSCFFNYYQNEIGFLYPDLNKIKSAINKLLIGQLEDEIIFIDIALIDNSIKGFIVYQIDSDKSDWNERTGCGFIREFYVDNSIRRLGVGTRLLKNAEKTIKNLGVTNIYLTANNKDYVYDFYFKNGYDNENKTNWKNGNEYFSKEL